MTDITPRKQLTPKAKARKLASILANHAAWEKRTMADLRVAGYRFVTVDQAFKYLQAQRTLASMSEDQVVEAVAQLNERKAS